MRNILVDTTIHGIQVRGVLETVVVRGHGFGVEALLVSIVLSGDTHQQRVEIDPRGHWLARFEHSRGEIPDGCEIGMVIGARAADAADPDGCYSTVEARIDRAG